MNDAPTATTDPAKPKSVPGGPAWVVWSGLATAGVTLLAVWALARTTGFEPMGLYAYYILPLGAFLVGLLAGSGYGLAAWWLNLRVSRALLWYIAGLQVLAYFLAQYIAFRHEIAGLEDAEGVSFWQYFDLMTRSFSFEEDGVTGEALGAWGYAFRALAPGPRESSSGRPHALRTPRPTLRRRRRSAA
jgi:hypothetical protein